MSDYIYIGLKSFGSLQLPHYRQSRISLSVSTTCHSQQLGVKQGDVKSPNLERFQTACSVSIHIGAKQPSAGSFWVRIYVLWLENTGVRTLSHMFGYQDKNTEHSAQSLKLRAQVSASTPQNLRDRPFKPRIVYQWLSRIRPSSCLAYKRRSIATGMTCLVFE